MVNIVQKFLIMPLQMHLRQLKKFLKRADATGDLIGNKIADKKTGTDHIMKCSRHFLTNV